MDNRVFDVSKPQHSKPDASGKPIIVGHHPQMTDPMVKEHQPKQLTEHHMAVKPSSPLETNPPPVENSPPTDQQAVNFGANPITPNQPVDDISHVPKSLDAPEKYPHLPDPSLPVNLAAKASPQAPNQDWHPEEKLPIPGPNGHHGHRRKKLPLTVLFVVVLILAVYALIDSKTIDIGIKLPVHIFNQDQATKESSTPVAVQVSVSSTPASTATYTVKNSDISFTYPTAWGTPTSTTDSGYSQRGGTNQPSGIYAYLLSFSKNKDIQIAVTASQYLPVARDSLYYDYLRWCTGTADGKIYKSLLGFSTANGVDTPTTAICNQGPLADAVKIDDNTIAQLKTKNSDGSVLGDLYTANLASNDLPVLRVKDATSANSEAIKKLLDSLKN